METRAERISFERSDPVPKANSNGNDSGSTTNQPNVHLIRRGKGGVGKSVIASWLAEFLIKRGQPVRCIDG
jgi:Mrp family chromosome partitioning ATPase